MKRPNRLDWTIYSIFRWWWNPIFKTNPGLALGVETEFKKWRLRGVDFEEPRE